MTQGNRENIVSDNIFENIHGMFAIESYSSDFIVSGNEISNSPVGALAHRGGTNLTVSENKFSRADILVQTAAGDVSVTSNECLDSRLILSENQENGAARDQILISDNLLRRNASESTNPMIQLADNVAENEVFIRENQLEDLSENSNYAPLIDLINGGTLETVEIIDNEVILPGIEAEFARTDSPNETIFGNAIVYESTSSPSLGETPLLERNEKDGSLSLTWNGKAGYEYQVQFSPDLKNWSFHGDSIPGSDREIRVNDLPTGTGDSMFYRVLIEETDA